MIVSNNFEGSIPSELGNLANLSTFIMSKFHNNGKCYYGEAFAKEHKTFIHFFFTFLCEGNNHDAGTIPTELGKWNKCKNLILRKFRF